MNRHLSFLLLAVCGCSADPEKPDTVTEATVHEQKLDPRERFIVEVRMMADRADELSLAEIGRRLGVSRERARQLEARAKQKLRRHLETHAGELSSAA